MGCLICLYPLLACFLKSIPRGAATTLFAAVSSKADKFNGEFLDDCNKGVIQGELANNIENDLSMRLWE